MVERTYPDLFRALAADVREAAAKDEDTDSDRWALLANVFDVAAERWDDRNYRGDRLLAAVGEFARAIEPLALDDPDDLTDHAGVTSDH